MLRKFLFLFVVVALASCHVLRPNLMLKTDKKYTYDSLVKYPETPYKLSQNDVIEFKMFSNDGFKLIDMTTLEGTSNNLTLRRGFEYHVENDGTVKLPVLGRVKLNGMTIREAETFLEEKYTAYYNKPFILLKVTNKRVIVFPGSDGNAKIVPLENDNTTLLEALALAGGIATNGKAYEVKLIRGDPKNPLIFKMDLSTVEGFKASDPILQANDIIYVEARGRYATRIGTEIAPYLSLITSLTSLVFLYLLLKKKI